MKAMVLSFQGAGKKAFLTASLLVVLSAFVLSTMVFIADRYAVVADGILDDPQTEERDVIDISEENLPEYFKAIETIEKATILAPLNSAYPRTLKDLYSRINVWQETMQSIGVAPPEDQSLIGEHRDAVIRNAKKAVTTDPANADNLLALGQVYASADMREAVLEQLIKAINSYPINGAIRYAAAMQMLMMGMKIEAQEQARLLARTDDSYRVDDDDPRSLLMRERRPPGYVASLAKSYLYKAMEIMWRASSRDQKAVLAIVPDNIDAREVARLFFEQKGIDFDQVNGRRTSGILGADNEQRIV